MAYVQFPDGRKEVLGFLNASDGVYTSARPDDSGMPVTDVFQKNAYDARNDMMKINSMQQKWRAGFTGTSLNPNKWDIIQTGAGQSITVSNGELNINAGTTPNAETIIMSKQAFSIPHRLMAHVKLSQRIVNQEFYIELVSIDRETGEPNSDSRAGWLFDNVTPTNAKYVVNGGDQPVITSSAVTVTTTASSGAIFEIEPTADEVWFFTRTLNSTSGRTNSFVMHSQIPNPNLLYKLQIRVKNLATAPASDTIFTSAFVNVSDYAELTAEITAGRGGTTAGQAIATTPTSLPTLPTVTTANVVAKNLATTFTTTAITTTTPFVSTSAMGDATSSMMYTKLRARFLFDQPVKVEFYNGTATTYNGSGNLKIQEETIPANTLTFVEVPLMQRYVYVRITNTGTATTTVHNAHGLLLGM